MQAPRDAACTSQELGDCSPWSEEVLPKGLSAEELSCSTSVGLGAGLCGQERAPCSDLILGSDQHRSRVGFAKVGKE